MKRLVQRAFSSASSTSNLVPPLRQLSPLTAVSSIDGRYHNHTSCLSDTCSEYALIRYRVLVELRWFQTLSQIPEIPQVPSFTPSLQHFIDQLIQEFDQTDAERVKEIEAVTNHDVKAVEYYLKERFLEHPDLQACSEMLHFGCTSEDVNNLAYALMLRDARDQVLLPAMGRVEEALLQHVQGLADLPMLSRTHGQAATPSTMGKELGNSLARLRRQRTSVETCEVLGKCNGAVGNFNAHVVAYPCVDWEGVSRQFVEHELGLGYSRYTTQIEPHDWLAELFDGVCRYNRVLLDLDRDLWSYVSLGYFGQKVVSGEVGSSTMPHKVNPIDFENSEGNLGIANALLGHLGEKLVVSRLQRDLSDSTALRSVGVGLGHSVIGYNAAVKGLQRIQVNEEKVLGELDGHWELLAEPVQMVMRKYDCPEPYERLKDLTRGRGGVSRESMRAFIGGLEIPEEERERLLKLTPRGYTGLASQLAKDL